MIQPTEEQQIAKLLNMLPYHWNNRTRKVLDDRIVELDGRFELFDLKLTDKVDPLDPPFPLVKATKVKEYSGQFVVERIGLAHYRIVPHSDPTLAIDFMSPMPWCPVRVWDGDEVLERYIRAYVLENGRIGPTQEARIYLN